MEIIGGSIKTMTVNVINKGEIKVAAFKLESEWGGVDLVLITLGVAVN